MRTPPKPLDRFGFREGSNRSRTAALYIAGATSHQVADAVGSPQLNVLSQLEAKGFTICKERVRIGRGRPCYKYWVEVNNEKET